jgi:hypothetical protein
MIKDLYVYVFFFVPLYLIITLHDKIILLYLIFSLIPNPLKFNQGNEKQLLYELVN